MISAEELTWIKERLKTYGIKYGEIYNEILDQYILLNLAAIRFCQQFKTLKPITQ